MGDKMRTFSFVLSLLAALGLVLTAASSAAAARKKPHVVVPKYAVPRPLPAQPLAVPLVAVPPLLVLYDLNRRINCLDPPDPAGLGGPGFDGKPLDPAKGNVMIPCWQRSMMKP